jgi:4a-hydroxytetrahydrobiopterin dehydratase
MMRPHLHLLRFPSIITRTRKMTTTTTSPTVQGGESVPEPQWSSTTTSIGRDNAKDLLSSGGWTLSRTRDGLEREFVFRGFAKAMTFMNQVADECKVRNHHPEWANVCCYIRSQGKKKNSYEKG